MGGFAAPAGREQSSLPRDAFQKLAEDEKNLHRLIRKLEQTDIGRQSRRSRGNASVSQGPTVLEQIGEFFEKLLETLKGLLRDIRFSSFAEDIHRNVKNTERLQSIFADELRQAGEMRRWGLEGRKIRWRGEKMKKMDAFRAGLDEMKDRNAADLFAKLADETEVHTSFKRNSYHKKGEIYLAKNATSSTIAHELFHKLDHDYGISESGIFSECIRKDSQRLKNIGKGYGSGIENLLYSKYPDAFIWQNNRNTLKEEYRGISDILHDMSGGEIDFGYRHDDDYWEIELALEKETWAQFGRILYQENDVVTDMLRYICEKTYPKMKKVLEEVMRNV